MIIRNFLVFSLTVITMACTSKPKQVQVGNCEGVLKNGKKDGVWVCSDIFGPVMKAEYVNGLKDGKVEIFGLGGTLESVSFWREGRYHGPFTYYFPNGQIQYQSQYEDGRQLDGAKEWDESGKEVLEDEKSH